MKTNALIETFREFETFARLSDDDLCVLASRASIESLPRKSVLFHHGDDDPWVYCLRQGSVELTAVDGRVHRVDAGTDKANHPLGNLKPRQHTATAVTPVSVIRIDCSDLGNWHAALTPMAYVVEEIVPDFDGPDADDDRDHGERLDSEQLELPSLPTIALEARRIIDRDDTDVDVLAKLVLNDPPIAAKLIKAANSPVFYGRGTIDTCERAIMRLGLKTTRQLLVAFAMRELFNTDSPLLKGMMETLWEHSTEVAAIAYALARTHGIADPDEAQLAGLLHDIGAVPVLSYAAAQPGLQGNVAAIEDLSVRRRPSIGARLLRSWNFPDQVVTVARDAEDWWRDAGAQPDLADVVVIAQLMSFLGKPRAVAVPPMARLPAFKKVFGGNAEPDDVQRLLAQAEEQIAEIQGLLRS